MKKNIRVVLIILLIAFVAIQFFQPERNSSPETDQHLFAQTVVPEPVQTSLRKACFDCHSDQTNYRWYHKIAPVSWYIQHHIEEGREELNFSQWAKVSALDRISLLEDARKEVEEGDMPLKSYTLIHGEARLDARQKDELFSWIKTYQESLLKEAMN